MSTEEVRRALAARLLESVDEDSTVTELGCPPGVPSEDDPGFTNELERRVARPDRSIPAAEALSAARGRLER